MSLGRRYGVFTIDTGFIAGILKGNGMLPKEAEVVEIRENTDGRMAVVIRHPDLDEVRYGDSFPEIKLLPGRKPKKMRRKGKAYKKASQKSRTDNYPWEQ